KETLTVTFSEAMKPGSLALGGTLAGSATATWKSSDTLELVPAPYWPAGKQTLVVNAGNGEGVAMKTLQASLDVKSAFSTFQAANVVIGQADFSGGFPRQDPEALSSGANTLDHPSSAVDYVAETNRLYIPDSEDKRVLVFDGVPDVNNANADAVILQPD